MTRLLGIVHAYNEADCIARTLHLLEDSEHEVHIFDHGSTDETADICYQHVRHSRRVFYHFLDRKEVPIKNAAGKQTNALWQVIADYIRQRADAFDWVTWLDADEVLRTHDGQLISRTAIEAELAHGTQVIRPLWREFWMTRRDPPPAAEPDFMRRLRFYRENRLTHSPRGWIPSLTPRVIPIARHLQDPQIRPLVHPWYGWWPQGVVVSNNAWLLDHYPVRSRAQAVRKIMRERDWFTPRPGKHRRYEQYRNRKCSNLVLDDARIRKGGWKRETRELDIPNGGRVRCPA